MFILFNVSPSSKDTEHIKCLTPRLGFNRRTQATWTLFKNCPTTHPGSWFIVPENCCHQPYGERNVIAAVGSFQRYLTFLGEKHFRCWPSCGIIIQNGTTISLSPSSALSFHFHSLNHVFLTPVALLSLSNHLPYIPLLSCMFAVPSSHVSVAVSRSCRGSVLRKRGRTKKQKKTTSGPAFLWWMLRQAVCGAAPGEVMNVGTDSFTTANLFWIKLIYSLGERSDVGD